MTTRKSTSRLVARIKRELANARELIVLTRDALVQAGDTLAQKKDELTQALNERDLARGERDNRQRWALENQVIYERKISELRKDLRYMQETNADLGEKKQSNFDKALRNADVAAVLACLVAKTSTPADIILKFAEAAEQMGVSPEVLEEVQTALKRGYAAQVEQVVSTAIDEGRNDEVDEVPLNDDELLDTVESVFLGRTT